MAGTQRAVDEAGAVAEQDDGQAFIANVELDLFENPDWNESGQAINDRPKAGFRQSRGDADHVLFGDATIQILIGMVLAQAVEQRIAMIAGEHEDIGIGLRGLDEKRRQRRSHLPADLSSRDAAA